MDAGKTIRDYTAPATYTSPSCIKLELNPTAVFVVEPELIELLPTFHGSSTENPYFHIRDFLEICGFRRSDGVTPE